MALDFLGALGAGLDTLGTGLSYDREQQRLAQIEAHKEDLRRLSEEATIRERDQLYARGRADQQGDRQATAQAALDKEQRVKEEAAQKKAADDAAFEGFLTTLPNDRARTIARGHRVGVTLPPTILDEPETPEAKAARLAAERKAKIDDAIAEYQRKKQIDKSLEVAPGAKDDPALPAGVRQYFAQMQAKYPNPADFKDELSRALPNLYAAHPHLDMKKVSEWVDAAYGKDIAGTLMSRPEGKPKPPARAGGPPNVIDQIVPRGAPSPTPAPPSVLDQVSGRGAPPPSILDQANTPGAATVKMRAPNGLIKDVPADQVDWYLKQGAVVVK